MLVSQAFESVLQAVTLFTQFTLALAIILAVLHIRSIRRIINDFREIQPIIQHDVPKILREFHEAAPIIQAVPTTIAHIERVLPTIQEVILNFKALQNLAVEFHKIQEEIKKSNELAEASKEIAQANLDQTIELQRITIDESDASEQIIDIEPGARVIEHEKWSLIRHNWTNFTDLLEAKIVKLPPTKRRKYQNMSRRSYKMIIEKLSDDLNLEHNLRLNLLAFHADYSRLRSMRTRTQHDVDSFNNSYLKIQEPLKLITVSILEQSSLFSMVDNRNGLQSLV